MWAPLFTEVRMGMSGVTEHDLFCELLIEAGGKGIPGQADRCPEG